MFEKLGPQAPDGILRLMQMFRDDTRTQKIDLGVGVYRDASGQTPVMRAVREAARRIWEVEETKVYTAMTGDQTFLAEMQQLILGNVELSLMGAAVATPGGTGALRQAFELVRRTSSTVTVWLSAPTWPNHPAMLDGMGMAHREYRYFNAETGGLDIEGMLADLEQVARGDVVLLHGCCHNPTGANLTPAQWMQVARVLEQRGAVALIDLAYQGFGDGMEEDALATRRLVAHLPEVLIAASCSKNFGVYRERTGILIATGASVMWCRPI